MEKFLTKILKGFQESLWLMETMQFNPLSKRRSYEDQRTAFSFIGERYVLSRRIEITLSNIKRIKEYCISEINDTFYNDHLKEWEGSDLETTYTKDKPYNYILGCWDNYPDLELPESVKEFIELDAGIDATLNKGLQKFFPEIKPHKINTEGEMKPVSFVECDMGDQLKAGSEIAAVDEFNERIKQIKNITEQKGDFERILALIG